MYIFTELHIIDKLPYTNNFKFHDVSMYNHLNVAEGITILEKNESDML